MKSGKAQHPKVKHGHLLEYEKNELPDTDKMRTFVVTGATDGIGLYTAELLAKNAPNVKAPNARRVIGLHGRNAKKLSLAADKVKYEAPNDNFVLKTFCYDLSDIEKVKLFVADLMKTFDAGLELEYNYGRYGQLDCLINNAAIIDYEAEKAPKLVGADRWERTMMVNVIAPFFINYKLLTEYGGMQRIVTTTSGAMSDMKPKLAPSSVPFVANPWSAWK